jgi:hypothetical protein
MSATTIEWLVDVLLRILGNLGPLLLASPVAVAQRHQTPPFVLSDSSNSNMTSSPIKPVVVQWTASVGLAILILRQVRRQCRGNENALSFVRDVSNRRASSTLTPQRSILNWLVDHGIIMTRQSFSVASCYVQEFLIPLLLQLTSPPVNRDAKPGFTSSKMTDQDNNKRKRAPSKAINTQSSPLQSSEESIYRGSCSCRSVQFQVGSKVCPFRCCHLCRPAHVSIPCNQFSALGNLDVVRLERSGLRLSRRRKLERDHVLLGRVLSQSIQVTLGPQCLQTARRSDYLGEGTDENGGSEAFLWKLVRLGTDEPDAQSSDSDAAQTFCRECDTDLFYALHPRDTHVYVFVECIQTVERRRPESNDQGAAEVLGWRRYMGGRANSTRDSEEGRVEPFVMVDSQERDHPTIVSQFLRQQSIETDGSSDEENEPSGSASSLREAEQCPTAATQLLASVFTTSSSSHSRPPNPLLLHRKRQQGLSYPLHSNNPRSAPCDPRALAALASYPPLSSSSSIISRASSASSWSVPDDTASFVVGPGGDLGLSAPHNAELNPLFTEMLPTPAQQSCTETGVPHSAALDKAESLELHHNLDLARPHSDENNIRTRSQSRQVSQ